ncbi:10449_t:CDS:1 [Gigaspora rosea]|nr:10449_t:CDS:1 [Gigaspora rosea]
MLPRSMSPPLSPNKPIKSLNQQRSLPSFRSTQSQPLSSQLQQIRDSQPSSPTQENSNKYPSFYNNNSNNSSPPKLKINTYPVSSNANSNKTENNKSDDSSSPIIETFTPMSKKTSFALVSRDNLALISGWIDGLDLSSPDDASYAVTEVPYKFKLLVRGSRHGFSDKIFHKRCDNKGPTITVIKLKGVDGMVIGGYNPVKWQSPLMRKFEKCHHSFVFSLKPNDNDRTYATIKAMQDEEMLEDSLACKYNISNRNLIINTTPLQHNSLFSRATYSKYAVNLCKSTGPAFGTTDLIMKDGEVTFKSDCYSLDLLKKIEGEMVSTGYEDVKSYMIEEYEVYLVLKRR